jgi:hypothetical protein
MDYLTTADNPRLQENKVFQKSVAVRIFKIIERKEMISVYRMVKGLYRSQCIGQWFASQDPYLKKNGNTGVFPNIIIH